MIETNQQILEVYPEKLFLSSDLNKFEIEIISNTNWKIEKDSIWLIISSNSIGNNNSSIEIICEQNISSNDRIGYITIFSNEIIKKIFITQKSLGKDIEKNTEKSTTIENDFNIEVKTKNNVEDEYNKKYVTLFSKEPVTIDKDVVVTSQNISFQNLFGNNKLFGYIEYSNGLNSTAFIQKYSYDPQSILKNGYYNIGKIGAKVKVEYVLKTEISVDKNLSFESGTFTINVYNTGNGEMAWSSKIENTSSNWLTITNGISGINSGQISVSYTSNSTDSIRTNKIIVTAPGATNSPKVFIINQDRDMRNELSLSTSSQEFNYKLGSFAINVNSNREWTSKTNQENSWIKINSGTTGKNSGTIICEYTQNNSTTENRIEKIIVSTATVTKELEFKQRKKTSVTIQTETVLNPSGSDEHYITIINEDGQPYNIMIDSDDTTYWYGINKIYISNGVERNIMGLMTYKKNTSKKRTLSLTAGDDKVVLCQEKYDEKDPTKNYKNIELLGTKNYKLEKPSFYNDLVLKTTVHESIEIIDNTLDHFITIAAKKDCTTPEQIGYLNFTVYNGDKLYSDQKINIAHFPADTFDVLTPSFTNLSYGSGYIYFYCRSSEELVTLSNSGNIEFDVDTYTKLPNTSIKISTNKYHTFAYDSNDSIYSKSTILEFKLDNGLSKKFTFSQDHKDEKVLRLTTSYTTRYYNDKYLFLTVESSYTDSEQWKIEVISGSVTDLKLATGYNNTGGNGSFSLKFDITDNTTIDEKKFSVKVYLINNISINQTIHITQEPQTSFKVSEDKTLDFKPSYSDVTAKYDYRVKDPISMTTDSSWINKAYNSFYYTYTICHFDYDRNYNLEDRIGYVNLTYTERGITRTIKITQNKSIPGYLTIEYPPKELYYYSGYSSKNIFLKENGGDIYFEIQTDTSTQWNIEPLDNGITLNVNSSGTGKKQIDFSYNKIDVTNIIDCIAMCRKKQVVRQFKITSTPLSAGYEYVSFLQNITILDDIIEHQVPVILFKYKKEDYNDKNVLFSTNDQKIDFGFVEKNTEIKKSFFITNKRTEKIYLSFDYYDTNTSMYYEDYYNQYDNESINIKMNTSKEYGVYLNPEEKFEFIFTFSKTNSSGYCLNYLYIDIYIDSGSSRTQIIDTAFIVTGSTMKKHLNLSNDDFAKFDKIVRFSAENPETHLSEYEIKNPYDKDIDVYFCLKQNNYSYYESNQGFCNIYKIKDIGSHGKLPTIPKNSSYKIILEATDQTNRLQSSVDELSHSILTMFCQKLN